jgi:hypothetical protein
MKGILSGTSGSIILLFGAGVSIDAGVPHTKKMIDDINQMLDSEWIKYKPIYEHLKQLFGKKNASENGEFTYEDLNIEKLFSQLDELLSLLDGKHNLYPFFKNWIDLFKNLYGFKDVKDFRDKIEDKLKEWIVPQNLNLSYYEYLLNFAKSNPGSGLRVFTLNYDRCVEEAFREFELNGLELERGFGIKERQNMIWKPENFEQKNDFDQSPDSTIAKTLFLYKMHGSIDWGRNEKQELMRINGQSIKELIFGTEQKVKAHDPYLYYVYQFRTFSLKAKVIIICGYGFFDSHINKILSQSLISHPDQKILICYWKGGLLKEEQGFHRENEEDRNWYAKQLELNHTSQILIWYGDAPTFFEEMLRIEKLENLFPDDEEDKLFLDTIANEEI